MSHFYNKKILFEPDFIWKKFLSLCFKDFSNAVLTNDILDANFLTVAKESAEIESIENDLPAVGNTRKSLVLMASENESDLATSDVNTHLQGIVLKSVKKDRFFPCSCVRQWMIIF